MTSNPLQVGIRTPARSNKRLETADRLGFVTMQKATARSRAGHAPTVAHKTISSVSPQQCKELARVSTNHMETEVATRNAGRFLTMIKILGVSGTKYWQGPSLRAMVVDKTISSVLPQQCKELARVSTNRMETAVATRNAGRFLTMIKTLGVSVTKHWQGPSLRVMYQ